MRMRNMSNIARASINYVRKILNAGLHPGRKIYGLCDRAIGRCCNKAVSSVLNKNKVPCL